MSKTHTFVVFSPEEWARIRETLLVFRPWDNLRRIQTRRVAY